MRRAYLCDFDGTVSPADIGAAFVRRFSTGGEREAGTLLQRWREGQIGSREVIQAECGWLSGTREEALEFTRSFSLDPDFARFARSALESGDRVLVVSDGYDFYIRDQLERAGLLDVPWAANRLRFEAERAIPEFPFDGAGCGRCGNCKGSHVQTQQAQGYEVVLVGDGLSDRCGAEVADQVIARGELLSWCLSRGIPAQAFDGFGDVARLAHQHRERLGRRFGDGAA